MKKRACIHQALAQKQTCKLNTSSWLSISFSWSSWSDTAAQADTLSLRNVGDVCA